MCAINGFIDFQSIEPKGTIIEKMNLALVHRGPDAQNVFSKQHTHLGHCRLSIIDLAKGSNQPFHSSCGNYTIVFNGEIYNYIELKKQLPNFKFKTNSDTEVLLELYVVMKEKCLDLLNGMFAFVIFEHQTGKLFMARDRFGIKPFYYHLNNKGFTFSSQIKGLLASNQFERVLNQDKLHEFLMHQSINDPYTLVKDVMSLQSGHFAVLEHKQLSISKWYDLEKVIQNKKANNSDAKKNIKELFNKAIALRMRSDVAFGAFLSGGIDSSMVVASMSQSSEKPVKTFSVVFDQQAFSEQQYAELIAQKYKTEHTNILLKPDDLLAILDDAFQMMDHPTADGINTYLVSKVTKEHGLTVALSGLGGDELFVGYNHFKLAKKIARFRYVFSLPLFLRYLMIQCVGLFSSVSEKLKAVLLIKRYDLSIIYSILRSNFTPQMSQDLLVKKSVDSNTGFIEQKENIYASISLLEFDHYLKNVLLRDSDVMSMAHSLEIRVPFLDHNLVEYVIGLSDNLKEPTWPKKLLTESLDGYLPHEIIHRKKMGFTFPWKIWLKNELKTLCEQQLKFLKSLSYFNADYIDTLWNRFLNDQISWSRIWILVSLGRWMQENDIK